MAKMVAKIKRDKNQHGDEVIEITINGGLDRSFRLKEIRVDETSLEEHAEGNLLNFYNHLKHMQDIGFEFEF